MGINETIAARLSELVNTHSQAVVARSGGVNESSVYHYQRGRRVPADFCVRLSDNLGINLNWLLTGSGSSQAGAATLEADAVGAGMERMVHILGALEAEAHGALRGTPTPRRLEKLNEMLKTWGQTEQRLNESLVPLADRLVKSIRESMTRMNLARAADILPGLEYLKRFDLPAATINEIDHALARFAFLDLDYERDFELRQKLLWRYLLNGGNSPREVLKHGFAVTHSAYGMGRYAEAVLMADGLLAATSTVPDGDADRLRLRVVRASCLVEQGRISEAVAELSDVIPRLPADSRDHYWGLHLRTLALSGAMDADAAFKVIESYKFPTDDTALFSLAMLESSDAMLRRAIKFAEKAGAVHPDANQPTNWLRAKCLLQAIDGDGDASVKRWLSAVDNSRSGKRHGDALRFLEVELLRLVGKQRKARSLLRQFWKRWDAGSEAQPVSLFDRAMVYRETLLLEPEASDLHARARVWLRRRVRRGYGYFRRWLEQADE